MSKFKICIHLSRLSEIEEIQHCNKKFLNMKVKKCNFFYANSLNAIRTIGSISENVTFLDLNSITLRTEAFCKLLEQCKSLKKLYMNGVRIFDQLALESSATFPEISLDSLILLSPFSVDQLDALSHINLQSKKIFIECGVRDYDDGDLPRIGNFLGKQKNLQSLGIKFCSREQRDVVLDNLLTSMITSLQHLLLILEKPVSDNDKVNLDNVNKFIEMNKNSLKSLEIECPSIPAETYETLIKHLKLEKLNISTENYPRSITFSSPNFHLKTLIFVIFHNVEELQQEHGYFFKAFPSIENLSIANCSNDLNEFLSSFGHNLKSVKNLSCLFPFIMRRDAPIAQLPSLRSMSTFIFSNESLESLKNVLSANPTIETLSITSKISSSLNYKSLDEITSKLTNLKRLFISQDVFQVDEKLLQMLTTNCKNLEILQVKMKDDRYRNYDLTHYGKLFFGYVDHDVEIEKELFYQQNSIWSEERIYCSENDVQDDSDSSVNNIDWYDYDDFHGYNDDYYEGYYGDYY